MMIVSLMAKAVATTLVMATAKIYHCLFYDSYKTIVAIVYFSFLVDENGERILLRMKQMEGVRGRGCCCFCDGNDNCYADDGCNSNNDSNY